jgi:uracil-DNA glycosylase
MAVDNEPEIFWDGQNEESFVDAWKRAVNFSRGWGDIAPVGRFNGSSGKWVNDNVFSPLKKSRQDTWLTDCLDTYRCSKGLAKRLEDTYKPLAERFGWTSSVISPHPDEDAIVAEALDTHRDRLISELAAAMPETVVTLGNAALRVFRALALNASEELPIDLSKLTKYGNRFKVRLGENRYAEWLPLAHPASPPKYQRAHKGWIKTFGK